MEILKKIGIAKFALLGGVLLLSLVMVVFLSFKLAAPPLSLLYTNLNEQDSAIVVSRLEGMDVPYSIGNGGKDVSVPVSKVLMLRMTFAQEGIPASGTIVGYEIFDKTESLGTSQFVYNVNLVRALEGELSRTIASLSPIESARVHLVMPKKELFSKVATDPSASVVLQMMPGQSLSKQEIAAVSHLVVTAVSGMKLDNITIIDSRGRPLKLANTEEGNVAAMTDAAEGYQKALEEKLKGTLEELLEKSIGIGKVKANVAAEINFDREVVNSEVYDPDGQVVRSKKTSEENETDNEKSSELTTATNLQGAQGAGAGGSNKNKTRTDEVTNYEISKTITNKISESGRVKRLSIAVLVDGNYAVKDAEDGTQEVTYTPRAQEELDKIKALAISAVGLDMKRGDKIEVVNMRFSDEFAALPAKDKPFAWIKTELDNIVQTVVIGIVIILVIILIVRPVMTRVLEMRQNQLEEAQFAETVMMGGSQAGMSSASGGGGGGSQEESFDINDVVSVGPEEKKKVNLLKYLNDMVDKHPEETVAILRNWLYSAD